VRRPRILLADDHILLTDAFRKLLEPEFEIVGTVSDGQALIAVAPQVLPDLIVVDLGLPLLNGMDAGRKLKELLPKVKLLVVTVNEDVGIAIEALREWAAGFLLKKSAGTELIYAIRELLAGKSYVTPPISQQLQREFIRNPASNGDKTLTPRQREVLQLLAEGHTMKEVARALSVSTRTVAFHKYQIMEDFNLHNNLELLRLALRERLVSPE
jgi:DNA-binding NarL/FixJ family response regulator